MKIKEIKFTTTALIVTLFAVPVIAYGAGLIPCGDTPIPGVTNAADHPCSFNDLILLMNGIMHFLIYDVAVPLAALGFMWTGANLVINQNKESAWSDAKGRFGDIALGFIIIIGAYVLIKFVLFAFLDTGSNPGLYKFLIS